MVSFCNIENSLCLKLMFCTVQLRFAVDRAKAATASAGKYQRLAKGEKENVKTGKKRKVFITTFTHFVFVLVYLLSFSSCLMKLEGKRNMLWKFGRK